MRAWRFIVPAAVFAVIAIFLLLRLQSGRDAKEIPSPLIGKPAPAFSLPLLHQAEQVWSPGALKGQVWLLNVWASWCVPCLAEHPLITQIAREGKVTVVGLNYKDEVGNARAWLAKHGDPYRGDLRSGRAHRTRLRRIRRA